MSNDLPHGILGLEKLREMFDKGLVRTVTFKSNVIGSKYIEVYMNNAETKIIDLAVPGKFRIKRESVERFANTVSNIIYCQFLFKILDGKFI